MLSASTSMPCSSIARMRSCPMIRVRGSTFSPISAIASGTAQCACTSTVFTRRPLTRTSRRRPPDCACASRALRRSQPTKAMPAIAPAAFWMNSLRVGIALLLSPALLIGANADFADQLSPLRRLRGDKIRELGRSHRCEARALGDEALLHIRRAHKREDLGVELRRNGGGQAGGAEHA